MLMLTAFLRRDWAIARSYRVPFVLGLADGLVGLVLFFSLGEIVDDSELASEAGLEQGYFAFAVLGWALLEVVQTGLVAFATRFRSDQTTGTLEALLATPAPISVLILGSALFDLVRALATGLALIGLAVVIFGFRPTLDLSGAGALVVVLPASLALFAALGIAIASFTVVFKQTTALLSLVSVGFAVFGGVYFPVTVMPGALEFIAEALPFTWALDVVRAALLEGDVPDSKLIGLAIAGPVCLPLAILLFQAAVNHSKRAGTLGQY